MRDFLIIFFSVFVAALFLPVFAYLAVYQPDDTILRIRRISAVRCPVLRLSPFTRLHISSTSSVRLPKSRIMGARSTTFLRDIARGLFAGCPHPHLTEEIAEVGTPLRWRCPVLAFHDFGGGNGADVAYGVHMAQGDVGPAEVVDEVSGSFGIACIFGDYPAVVPDVAAFARHFV